MDNLSNTYYAKFSTQQKVIYFGQHGFSSRTDSFGDIPGHGVICIYLDLLVLWTLKSSLVLVSGTSFVDHKKEPIEGFKRSGMPMGETIQFVPSMLDAGYSGSRELRIFNTWKPLYEFNKDFTLDLERNFSADLLFRYSLFFQIRSNIFNCRKWLCIHRFLFLWWPRLFSALWVSAVTQE